MIKMFKLQKISMVLYIIASIVAFIYSLCFMTAYADLGKFTYPINQPLIDFNSNMQGFNFMMFYFAVASLISILFLFSMQVFKKVCDKLALIVVNVFASLGVICSILVFVFIPMLVSEYDSVEALGLFSNNIEQISTWVHEMSYTAFNIGYFIYAIMLVTSLMLIVSTIVTNRKFVKEMAGE